MANHEIDLLHFVDHSLQVSADITPRGRVTLLRDKHKSLDQFRTFKRLVVDFAYINQGFDPEFATEENAIHFAGELGQDEKVVKDAKVWAELLVLEWKEEVEAERQLRNLIPRAFNLLHSHAVPLAGHPRETPIVTNQTSAIGLGGKKGVSLVPVIDNLFVRLDDKNSISIHQDWRPDSGREWEIEVREPAMDGLFYMHKISIGRGEGANVHTTLVDEKGYAKSHEKEKRISKTGVMRKATDKLNEAMEIAPALQKEFLAKLKESK